MGLRWKLLLPPALCGLAILAVASAGGSIEGAALGKLATGLLAMLVVALLSAEVQVMRPLARLGDVSVPADEGDAEEIARWDREVRSLRRSLAQTQASLEQVRDDWRDARTGLQRSEERFAAAVRGAHDGLWEWEPESGAVLFSPRWKAMLGYAEDEFPDRYEAWLDHLHPDDLERVQQEIAGHLEGTLTHFEQQLRMRHKDGRYRWLLSRGAALRHASGKPYRLVGLDTDITRVKRVEGIVQQIAEGTDGARGEVFFRALVQHFAAALEVGCAFITECVDQPVTRVRTLAYWKAQEFRDNIEFDLSGTPCEAVVKQGVSCVYRSGVGRRFPRDAAYESYIGLPIFGSEGGVIGHLAFFDTREMSEEVLSESIFRIFTARAGAELERRSALARLAAGRACAGRAPVAALPGRLQSSRRAGLLRRRVRLHSRRGAAKGVQLGAGAVDRDDVRVGCEVHVEAARAGDLGHQVDVGQARRLAEAEIAAPGIVRQHRFQRREAGLDPGAAPGIHGRIVAAEMLPQVFEDAAVVDRMDVAADDGGHRPHMGARSGFGG